MTTITRLVIAVESTYNEMKFNFIYCFIVYDRCMLTFKIHFIAGLAIFIQFVHSFVVFVWIFFLCFCSYILSAFVGNIRIPNRATLFKCNRSIFLQFIFLLVLKKKETEKRMKSVLNMRFYVSIREIYQSSKYTFI